MSSPSSMKTAGRTVLTLTLGLTLGACQDPPIEGSDETETGETETGDGDGDPGDGDGDPGDGDGDPGDGDGDPGDGDPGDGDGDPSECGNGMVEEGEACDDGNEVEDDECTNACQLPACGDGILHEGEGEACDDGNVEPGDGCTAACQLPGAELWSMIIDVNENGDDDIGYEVVLDSGDNIDVVLTSNGDHRLAEYDSDGIGQWNYAALDTDRTSLDILSTDYLVIGGTLGNQGAARAYDSDGNLAWTELIPANNSSVLDVAVDDMDFIIGAGYIANGDAHLYRDDDMGAEQWEVTSDGGDALGPVAVGANGQIWVIRSAPDQLETYTADGQAGWTSIELSLGIHEDLVVDGDGNAYLLSGANDNSLISLTKFDNAGEITWTVMHDDPQQLEIAGGLALLPGGGVIIAGSTNGGGGGSDALLAFYDGEGESIIPDIVLDGDLNADDFDVFYGVAVGDGYGVAVGSHDPAGQSDSDLWLHKFEL